MTKNLTIIKKTHSRNISFKIINIKVTVFFKNEIKYFFKLEIFIEVKENSKKFRNNFPFNTWWSMDSYPKTQLFFQMNVKF